MDVACDLRHLLFQLAGGTVDSARRGPVVEELTPAPDPAQCCEQLEGLPYRLFLDSAAGGARLGRYSFVMADPVAVVRTRGDTSDCDG